MRAQARLERAARAVGCQPEAIEWMESALDPFPDDERRIAGYPDMISGKSIVQAFRQKVTVNGPGSGNWDCSISCDGYFNSNPVQLCGVNGGIITPGSGPLYNLGGIQVRWAASGTNLYLPTVQNASCMAPVVAFTSPYRVIATAVEIWNTTAPLYKQGNVVVWRQPRQAGDWGALPYANLAATTFVAPSKTYDVPTIPENPTNALILQGSKSWSAEKGVYMVGTLCQQEIPVQELDFSTTYSGAYYSSNGNNYATVVTPTAQGTVTYPVVSSSCQDTSFNQFGAYFTGLSQQTTLDVVWHYIVERFPQATQTDLVTMASNSCPFDPKCLELYSKTIYHLPVGVWVEENGLGDWICECADVLGTFGVPGMGLVKMGTKAITGIANAFDRQSSAGESGRGGTIAVSNEPYYPPADPEIREQVARSVLQDIKKERKANRVAKIGPALPNGKFKSAQAKAKKKKNKRKGKR